MKVERRKCVRCRRRAAHPARDMCLRCYEAHKLTEFGGERLWTDEFGVEHVTDADGKELKLSDEERVRLMRRLRPGLSEDSIMDSQNNKLPTWFVILCVVFLVVMFSLFIYYGFRPCPTQGGCKFW